MASFKKSFLIMGSEKVIMTILQFLCNVILAHILAPDDFGVISMVALFIALSTTLVESGLGGSLIYYKDVKKEDYDTVFWFNICVAVILYCILFITSDSIAEFYETEVVSPIIKVLGIVLLCNAVSQVSNTILFKELKFKQIAILSVVAYVLSSILSIVLALLGLGVWALVALQVGYSVFLAVFRMVIVKYTPSFSGSFVLLKKHLNIGAGLLGASLVKSIYDNIYLQITGKFFSVRNAGLFNQANKLENVPVSFFSRLIDDTLFPILSACDKTEFDKRLRRVSAFMSFLVTPIFLLIALCAESIVKLLLGVKWLDCSWMLTGLCIGAAFLIFESINRSGLKAKGKTKEIFKIEILKRLLSILVIFMGLYLCGMYGIVAAFIFNSVLGWICNSLYLSKISSYSIHSQLLDMTKYFIPSICVLGSFYWMNEVMLKPSIYVLLLESAMYFLGYIVVCMTFKDTNILYLKETVVRRFIKTKMK